MARPPTKRFVHAGPATRGPPQADPPLQVVEHAGFQRSIISRNPPLIDEEGYEIDSDDDEERVQEAVASAMEENPYSSIHIERECTRTTAA